jgi:hypothetical protein
MSENEAGRRPSTNEELISALEREIEALRLEITQLKIKNADLLKAILERDYERPPHWRE